MEINSCLFDAQLYLVSLMILKWYNLSNYIVDYMIIIIEVINKLRVNSQHSGDRGPEKISSFTSNYLLYF